MTDVLAPPPPAATTLRLVRSDCPVCGADAAEPVAVGADLTLQTSSHSFLAMRCSCGLTYLDPHCEAAPGRLCPPEWIARRRARALAAGDARRLLGYCRDLAPDARILVVGAVGDLDLAALRAAAAPGCSVEALAAVPELVEGNRGRGPVHIGEPGGAVELPGGYTAILLLAALERWADPLAALSALRGALQPGGRLVLRTPNAESRVARMFGGRHWAGYDFPRHPCLYGPAALRALARRSGWEVEVLTTVGGSGTWRESTVTLLADWNALSGWAPILARAAAAVGWIADSVDRARPGNRPWLEAVLRPGASG